MNEVFEIQEALRTVSFADPSIPLVAVDGIYGFQTRDAVATFQRQYGLPITGETDTVTWDRLMQIRDSASGRNTTPLQVYFDEDVVIAPGSNNEIVAMIKSMIHAIDPNTANSLSLDRSPRYDPNTVRCIRTLRKLHDLEDTDLIDLDVWEILAALYNTRQRYGREVR